MNRANSSNLKELVITLAFRKIADGEKGILKKFICFFTKSKYYHVELIVNNVWISSSFRYGGVSIRPLRPYNPLENTKYDYKELPLRIISKDSYKIIENYLLSLEGSKYDTAGILFSQLFPLRYHKREKWFCSEIVTKILQLFIVKEAIALEPHTVSPGDLSRLFGME